MIKMLCELNTPGFSVSGCCIRTVDSVHNGCCLALLNRHGVENAGGCHFSRATKPLFVPQILEGREVFVVVFRTVALLSQCSNFWNYRSCHFIKRSLTFSVVTLSVYVCF